MSNERIAPVATSQEAVDRLPAAVRQQLQQCFKHGSKLMEKEKYDFDYANSMFTECVARDPGNLMYVEALLSNLIRKYDGNKKGARFPGLSGGGGRAAFKKAYSKKNWEEVLKLGPHVLKANPWDVPTLRALAEACEAFEYREAELRYLRMALDGNVKDPDVNRHCARSLQRMGQFDQAIVCWHRVEEALKNDKEAPQMISQLQMEKTRASAGFGPAQSVGGGSKGSRSSINIAPPTAAMAKSAQAKPAPESSVEGDSKVVRRPIESTARQQLEQRLHEFADDTDTAKRLAQLHREEGRAADAERVLQRALAASGNELSIRELWEEVLVEKQQQRQKIAEELARKENSESSQALVQQVRQEALRAELDFYVVRTGRYPTDFGLKLELGRRLRRIGNVAEAAKVLLEVAQNGIQKAQAYLELGECLQLLKQYQRAFEAYRRSIAAGPETGTPDLTKFAMYRAGILAAGLNDRTAAEKLFRDLLDLDPHYKDTADRLDKLTNIRDNS